MAAPSPARIEDPCREPGVLPAGVDPGLHCIELVPVPDIMEVKARAILGRAASPYGVAVTSDGRQRWAVTIHIDGLPQPDAFGPYRVYVAWAMTPTLESVTRLGPVRNGTTVVAEVALDKFLLMVSAEPDTMGSERRGRDRRIPEDRKRLLRAVLGRRSDGGGDREEQAADPSLRGLARG
jgi:hypothetical protein